MQLMESPKARIVIKENPLYDNTDFASSRSKGEAHPNLISVMMIDVTVEATMAKIERKMNLLMKDVEERDHKISSLTGQMQTRKTTELNQTSIFKDGDKGKNVVQENQPQQQSASL